MTKKEKVLIQKSFIKESVIMCTIKKIRVFADENFKVLAKNLRKNNIDFYRGQIDYVDHQGEKIAVQTIYMKINKNSDCLFLNKIKKNKKFIYDVPSTKYIKKYFVTYMSVKDSNGFEEANYFDCEIIGEFKSYKSAMSAFNVAKQVHNDGTTIGVVMHTYDASLPRNTRLDYIFNEVIAYHHGD